MRRTYAHILRSFSIFLSEFHIFLHLKNIFYFFKKVIDIFRISGIILLVRQMPHGLVVQSVSTPACHAGGRRFESVRGRHKRSHPFGWLLFCYLDKDSKIKCSCPVGSGLFPARREQHLNFLLWRKCKRVRARLSSPLLLYL